MTRFSLDEDPPRKLDFVSSTPSNAPVHSRRAFPPSLKPVNRSIPTQPTGALGESERQRGKRLAARLVADLKRLVMTMPVSERTATGMSARLRLSKTSCHRLVKTIHNAEEPGIGHLVELPGPSALRAFAAAIRKAGADGSRCDALLSSTDLFEEFLRHTGGSQSALQRALKNLSPPGESGRSAESVAEEMHRCAAHVCDAEADVLVAISLEYPSPRHAGQLDALFVYGIIGYTAGPAALPLPLYTLNASDDAGALTEYTAIDGESKLMDRAGRCLLTQFSTSPLPMTTGDSPYGQAGIVHVIDPRPATDASQPRLDVVIAHRAQPLRPDPRVAPPHTLEGWLLINHPYRHMIFDRYVHRDLTRQTTLPVAGCHVWTPDFRTAQGSRWLTQLAVDVPLRILPPQFDRCHDAAYARLVELTSFLFQQTAMSRDEFDGFRISMPFPLWRTIYRSTFEVERVS